MYYVRTFKSGAGDYDPRQRIWAVYKCALCDKETEIDITRVERSFQFRERVCPHCGQLNAEDKVINLKAQINKLTVDKSRIEVEIGRLERELNECKTTLSNNHSNGEQNG
jgi:DNA-directed RNA polymerase subunit RPC12/RpoP